ncbi:hypothetical protein BACCAP_03260 [Pseudoflavonifractor capillosus ATCC 29799]|uniref:Uncharacterized protein n=1 Tax=Pseudoflavonifractor capillosus ATCC 29799 TaxID=411467 RepID=A6NYF9_9FIRM|nr:hypothetical protein BACCAP_03260 [Pseudoflavonifractor capillosus ATCC 29799]
MSYSIERVFRASVIDSPYKQGKSLAEFPPHSGGKKIQRGAEQDMACAAHHCLLRHRRATTPAVRG